MKRLLTSMALAAFLPCVVQARDFPTKPVTAVVQMAPGGPTDLIVRAIQAQMGAALGESLVVENRSGASGLIGLRYVLSAPPNGYTVGIATGTSHGVAVNYYNNLPYDPLKDFKSVGGIALAPGVVLTRKDLVPDCKFETLVTKLRERPGDYKFGSPGAGTLGHMSAEAFMNEVGVKMMHVPYRGLAPAITDLYGGVIDVVFDNISSSQAHLKSGKICAVAIQAPKRLDAFPDIPTYEELGHPGLNRPAWYGMIVRSDTPDDVVKSLNAALNQALETDAVKKTFQGLGISAMPGGPEPFRLRMQDEIEYWRDVVKRVGIAKETL
ncbi:Bug family tripartite tricarboxylate transporter substrate binding protein [Bordetella genomosp. 5]|uniref:Twin-arginine translocation pathway signal n=1 Tax=Bordetella genomosp. 5 TaxID=1395608 RepID=A0A261TWJ4_9BORD|nr:tripartite tricarboxylate transporter substrate binding protein [Bordetella genomosp. 5]OZI53637.1 twin-arginine translocation pathway signal [Bordetella genomosp. 5]